MANPEPPAQSSPAAPAAVSDNLTETVIPLQTLTAEPSDGVRPRPAPSRGLDVVLAGAVLLFAFLAASFVARNSDLWFHLAAGRLLAEGRYSFGTDPFTYTAADAYWVNHAWLFDALLYRLYGWVGGAGLVVLKALLITALAALLLSVRRRGACVSRSRAESGIGAPDSGATRERETQAERTFVVPALCTALALLVMSPRLLLQPACVSLFLLGVTFWLLWRSAAAATFGQQLRRAAPLLVLFALWVNLDSWFFLGPVLVALFWLGGRLQALLPGKPPAQPHVPTWLLPASVAVCLLNPHHVHAFTLPTELSPLITATGLPQDVRFQRMFASPWQIGVRWEPAGAVNLADWAYFILTGLGLVSFVLNRERLSGWRLATWVGFGLLGAWQARLAPFFAVIAGPITALNFQDALAVYFPPSESATVRLGPALGRLAALAGVAALAVLAWVGWLHGFQSEGRRVAWAVEADPTLRHVAETLREWRRDGRLTATDRGFQFHPDVVHYCAWFCPDEPGFFDHRFTLSLRAAQDYEIVCRDFNPALGPPLAGREADGTKAAAGWQQILRDRGVSYIVLYDPDLRRVLPTVERMAQNPQEWSLLHVDGSAVIFGWERARPSPAGGAFAGLRLDVNRLAYGPADGASSLPEAPASGPERPPQPHEPWDRLWKLAPPSAWESGAAVVFLRLFEVTAKQQQRLQEVALWARMATGLLGASALDAGPLSAEVGLRVRMHPATPFLSISGEQSPALPLLAVRAARSALAANPDDANAWLVLGQAYLALARLTGEYLPDRHLPPLALLRHVQAVTALERTLLLRPDLALAHDVLAQVYEERQFLDAALEHRRAHLRLVRAAGPASREDADQFQRRLDLLERRATDLERLVQDRQNQFVIRAHPLGDNPFAKAQLALDLGLPRVALDDVLLRSSVLLFGGDGARLELQLLLMTGRTTEAAALLNDAEVSQNKGLLSEFILPGRDRAGREVIYRFPAYEWLVLCQAAADGAYDRAATVLREGLAALDAQAEQGLRQERRALPLALASELGLCAQPPHPLGFQNLVREERQRSGLLVGQAFFMQAETVGLRVIQGLLALEEGRAADAATAFTQALAAPLPEGWASEGWIGRPLAADYRSRMRSAGTR